jgi:hypothetical protein
MTTCGASEAGCGGCGMGIPGALGICPIACAETHKNMITSVLCFIFYLFYFIVKCFYIIFLLFSFFFYFGITFT